MSATVSRSEYSALPAFSQKTPVQSMNPYILAQDLQADKNTDFTFHPSEGFDIKTTDSFPLSSSVSKAQTQFEFVERPSSQALLLSSVTASDKPAVSPPAKARAGELSPVAQSLYDAMKRTGTKANEQQKREIARELEAACKAFKMDPKLMLALFKHESAGIDPKARSFTGALGLGQLTDIAMLELIRIAKTGQRPFNQHRAIFEATYQNPTKIKNNVWTSVAYLALMKDRWGANTTLMLKRYGDPYVPTYAQKVYQEYRNLFGKSY
jgi:hypothetical protein